MLNQNTNNMNSLKNVELTENDFKLIYDALEHLPAKNLGSDLMGMMLGGLMPEGEAKLKYEREIELKRQKEEQKRTQLIEEIRLLQAKLISLKRLMVENNLIKKVNDFINPNEDRA